MKNRKVPNFGESSRCAGEYFEVFNIVSIIIGDFESQRKVFFNISISRYRIT